MEHKNTMPEALITFCYPSTLNSRDLTSAFQNPTPVLQGFCRQEPQTLYITAGIVFDSSKNYLIRVDVTLNGQTLTPTNDDASFGRAYSPSISATSEHNKLAAVTTMELPPIDLSKDGTYCVVVEIHESDGNRKLIRKIATKDCIFIVC